jgi:tetratricopeptide (TPR) repeat protein
MRAASSIKRSASAILLLFSTVFAVAADAFTDSLQWLAKEIACIGTYSNAQAGDYTHPDPTNYYKPSDIREYLARQSGNRTKTATFYGICFDYAQEAYNDILNNQSYYENLGMKKGSWYIAMTYDNPNVITLNDPVSKDKAILIRNGVYLKENTRFSIQAHGAAPNHAWLWVYGKDGTIYWIDPTWTDNTGYVWWGIVRDGKEVQWNPSKEYCVVAINPNNEAFAYFNSGYAYGEKGDYDRAIADYTQAIRIDPNHAKAYNNRGAAYADKRDNDRAIADYTQAIRIDPNYALAYNNRGNAYGAKGDNDRAIADYTQAIRIDPNHANSYYNRGLAYHNKRDYDRAIADWTQAIRLDPNLASAYYNRGVAYKNKGDSDRAIADYTQAIRIDPNVANAYVGRGVAYHGKKDYDRAIADYTQAIRLDPNVANARNNLELARKARENINTNAVPEFQSYDEAVDYRNRRFTESERGKLNNFFKEYGTSGDIYFDAAQRYIIGFSRTLKLQAPRMSGSDVLKLQERLLSLGFSGVGEADGYYGPKSEGTIKIVQRFLGYQQNGEVDILLWNTIFNENKKERLLQISRDAGR